MTRRDRWLRGIAIVPALVVGGWLIFDGARAAFLGDYVTPTSGPHAGQLGPWADLVAAAGIEPRSTMMKSVHLLLGAGWVVSAVLFARRWRHGRSSLLTCAALSLWYLPFGTLLGAVEIILLLQPAMRHRKS